MTDFLAEKRNEIAARLNELKPLVEEAERLQAALDALDGATKRPTVTRRRKPAARKVRSGGTGKPGRPKGSGKRAAEALRLVTAQPGITISELAPLMDIHQNYLYRVLPGLQADGKVRKEGRGWYPVS